MNQKQLQRMRHDRGFIAALDQSGGSTPRALQTYGIEADRYSGEDEMFDLVHAMRSRIITSPSFDSRYILAAILFEQTMDREIVGRKTGDYLWDVKGIVPFLKVDKGLADEADGIQLMKPMPELDSVLERARKRNIFGTKMRSVIHSANPSGIRAVIDQQFEIGRQIADAGLVPILEPEINIKSPDIAESEKLMLNEIERHLTDWPEDLPLMFKLSIPSQTDLYAELMKHPAVVRVVALSGGYSREEANERLTGNHGLIASFSRALSEGLRDDQSDEAFDAQLADAVQSIYAASIT